MHFEDSYFYTFSSPRYQSLPKSYRSFRPRPPFKWPNTKYFSETFFQFCNRSNSNYFTRWLWTLRRLLDDHTILGLGGHRWSRGQLKSTATTHLTTSHSSSILLPNILLLYILSLKFTTQKSCRLIIHAVTYKIIKQNCYLYFWQNISWITHFSHWPIWAITMFISFLIFFRNQISEIPSAYILLLAVPFWVLSSTFLYSASVLLANQCK